MRLIWMVGGPVGQIGVALVVMVAAVPPLQAQARGRIDSFDFATRQTGHWKLRATTAIDWPSDGKSYGAPTVGVVSCGGQSPGIEFDIDETGVITQFQLNLFVQDGKREGSGVFALLGDHIWLYLDGERWESANIRMGDGHFSNVDYASEQRRGVLAPDGGKIVINDWRGYRAVRKNERDPWMDIRILYDRILSARKFEWGFKSRNWSQVDKGEKRNQLPRGWEKARYPIDNSGLRDAVMWCARQVSSDRAHVLPDGSR